MHEPCKARRQSSKTPGPAHTKGSRCDDSLCRLQIIRRGSSRSADYRLHVSAQALMTWGHFPGMCFKPPAAGTVAHACTCVAEMLCSGRACNLDILKDLSFNGARKILAETQKACSITRSSYRGMGICLWHVGQELDKHGAELDGQSQRIRRAGGEGRWPSNVERDITRSMNRNGMGLATGLYRRSAQRMPMRQMLCLRLQYLT